ncbi:DUF2911 domain-containing protein [Marinoscillum sp.]|uniref:DUF2911 domain-containing protein n=1 Tax=Marinoscillum sp. TaxID=2024838 RepID=UPI003BAA779F
MSKIAKLTLICLLFVTGSAMAQIDTPQPSPAGSVYSKVGLTDVTIDYFRPGVKGRKIFGSGDEFLEQFGEVWRTGANSGSMITFSTDLKVAGQDVKAGEYQIVSIPGKDEWQVMLISEPIGGNESAYDESKAVVKAKVKPAQPMNVVERMTFQITDISADNTKANIQFSWANVMWNLPIEVNYKEQVMKDIAQKTQVNPAVYSQAANFYLSQNMELEKALEYMNKYLAIGENSNQFWNVHTKALILKALGKKKEAIETAKQSMETAKASPNGDFGYVKRNQDLIDSLK